MQSRTVELASYSPSVPSTVTPSYHAGRFSDTISVNLEDKMTRFTTLFTALMLTAFVLSVTGPAFAQEWIQFASSEDGFRVAFPEEPEVEGRRMHIIMQFE